MGRAILFLLSSILAADGWMPMASAANPSFAPPTPSRRWDPKKLAYHLVAPTDF